MKSFPLTKIRGQHLLRDSSTIRAIIEASGVTGKDIVVEVGPGAGALTIPLANRAALVIAVEIDAQAVAYLKGHIAPNINIIHGDILERIEQDPSFVPKRYLLVANLPFNISSEILRLFLTDPRIARPLRVALILQYELARRITVSPGAMSMLSVLVQATSKAEFIKKIPRGSFSPPPRVDAALVRLTPALHKGLNPHTLEPFFSFVRAGFAQRRRQLQNTLAAAGYPRTKILNALTKQNLRATIRPQDLSIDEWVAVFRSLS